MRHHSALVLAALLLGCGPKAPSTPAAALGPIGDVGEKAIIIPVGDEAYTGSGALWQGFEHQWGYNHRLNRLGSLVTTPPSCAHTSENTLCEVQWSNSGASGSGPDKAQVATLLSLISMPNVGFASVVHEFKISGTENELIQFEGTVEVPLDAYTAAADTHVALLNGFDLSALESADKLIEFSLQLSEPSIEGDRARVKVSIDAKMSCDSPECPAFLDDVDYSIQVGVAVIGGPSEALTVSKSKPALEYEWDGDEEMDLAITAAAHDGGAGVVRGIRGFRVVLDREMHMLQMGMSVQDSDKTHMQFKNWRTGMRQASPPLSWTAYREEGKASWAADVVDLTIAGADVIPVRQTGAVKWRGIFGPSSADGNEKSVALGTLTYGQRANYGGTDGSHPVELAGYGLEDLGQTKGIFDPILKWLDKGGRQDSAIAGRCEEAIDLAADGAVAAHLTQALSVSDTLAGAIAAALASEGESMPEEMQGQGRVVLGSSIAAEGSKAGGVFFVFEEDGKQMVVAEDVSLQDGEHTTTFTGLFTIADGAPLDWNGTVWSSGLGGLDAMIGTLKLTNGDEGQSLSGTLEAPCGESLEVAVGFKEPGRCKQADGRLASASLTSGDSSVEIAFDNPCDGCGAVGDAKVCLE